MTAHGVRAGTLADGGRRGDEGGKDVSQPTNRAGLPFGVLTLRAPPSFSKAPAQGRTLPKPKPQLPAPRLLILAGRPAAAAFADAGSGAGLDAASLSWRPGLWVFSGARWGGACSLCRPAERLLFQAERPTPAFPNPPSERAARPFLVGRRERPTAGVWKVGPKRWASRSLGQRSDRAARPSLVRRRERLTGASAVARSVRFFSVPHAANQGGVFHAAEGGGGFVFQPRQRAGVSPAAEVDSFRHWRRLSCPSPCGGRCPAAGRSVGCYNSGNNALPSPGLRPPLYV